MLHAVANGAVTGTGNGTSQSNGRHAPLIQRLNSNGHAPRGTGQEQELLETTSSIIDTFDTYDEERISIDLKEGSYHKA